tara:strand:- start:2186 stop:2644 length:459 start_codon:yes stop_codon:yes gene_type:complete
MTRIVYLDKRVRTDPQEYAVAFSAQDGELGHAFASLIWGDEVAMATMRKGVGFYPDGTKGAIKSAFGAEGAVLDDTWEKSVLILSVLVNKPEFDAAESIVNKWEKPTPYFLGISDCTTFVGEMAASIGLDTPSRLFSPYPIQYVKGLISENE